MRRHAMLASAALAVVHFTTGAVGGQQGAAGASEQMRAKQQALEVAWSRELAESTKPVSPVKRVVNLLMKMKEELEAEATKEAEMYDKMVCWCETNEKEKTQAVSDAEAKDSALSSEIEARSGRFGVLSVEIAQTKEDIAENTAALKEATAIREGEAAKFREDEKQLVQAIGNLRNAIAVLSKHQQALLQFGSPMMSSMRVLLRDVALKYEMLVAGRAEAQKFRQQKLAALQESAASTAAGDAQGTAFRALLQAIDSHGPRVPDDMMPLRFATRLVGDAAASAGDAAGSGRSFLQMNLAKQPIFESRSAGRSAGIYGVLNQMLEEFGAELSTSQKQELEAQEGFKALSAAKEAEIEAGKTKLDEMEMEAAANSKALGDAKEDLTNTRAQRSADIKFLQNLKLTCNDLDHQWEQRRQTRSAETTAVAEAIAVLTEDDNREMLHKAVALLQESSEADLSQRRGAAEALLRRAAEAPDYEADDLLAAWRGRSASGVLRDGAAAGPRAQLSTLATAVQLDSFTKVKEMIDKMLEELKKQQAEEVTFKAHCGKNFDETEKATFGKTALKKDLEVKIDQLDSLISRLQTETAAAKEQIAATQVAIKKAGQSREAENAEFQSVVSDQRATQSILQKALEKLKDFYEKGIGNKVSLAQRSAQTPPVQFNTYKAHGGSSSVIGLIEQIVEDSKALEKETTDGEFKAQADYEQFVKDSNGLISTLQTQVTEKAKATAAADGDKAQAGADHQSTVDELESLAAYEADLHNQCDFVMKNFDVRQKARMQEMESIKEAKAILSGAQ